MKKRLLAIILCMATVLSVIPSMLMPLLASESTSENEIPATVSYDDLYVKDASFRWDAYALTAESGEVTVFENEVGDTDLTMKGTVGNKFVRSQTPLELGNLISQYLSDDGNNYYFCNDVTFEIVLHQHWDDALANALDVTYNKQYVGIWTSSLVKDYARALTGTAGCLPFRVQDPNATTNKYPGYIKTSDMCPVNPTTGKQFNWSTDDVYASQGQFYANEVNEPFTMVHSFAFDCENEYPQFDIILYRADTGVNATTTTKFFPMTTKQGYTLFPAQFAFGYYAIRAYNRVLEVSELQQNHFADLAKYFEISDTALNAYVSLSDDAKVELHADLAKVNFNDTSKEAIEKAIEDKAAAMAEAEKLLKVKELYRSLYVEDAVFVWNAFLYGSTKGGFMVDLFDDTKKLGDGSVAIEKNSGFGYAAYAGTLDFTSLIKQGDGTYGDELNLEIGLRFTSDYGNISRFFGPLGHISQNKYDAVGNDKFTWSTAPRTDGYGHYGILKNPTRALVTTTVKEETFYFKNEQDTAPITKADYDALDATAKAAYTLSAVVPYYSSTVGVAFDQPGWYCGHVLGNDTGKTFSFGLAMSFDTANSSFDFAFLRDTEPAFGRGVAYEGLLYTPGVAYAQTPKLAAPTSYEAAINNTALQNTKFNDWTQNDEGFYFGQASAEYYSIHLYDEELTDMQRKQNHFADLVSYFQPSNIEAFIELPDVAKEKLYTMFSEREDLADAGVRNTSFEEVAALGGKAYIETVIDAAELVFAADEVLSFEGYQTKIYGTPAYRAVFALHDIELPEGYALKQVGILYGTDGFDTLAYVKESDGSYSLDSAITNTVVYADGEWDDALITNRDGGSYVMIEKKFDGEQTPETLREKSFFRGYVILDKGGREQVYYTSMAGMHVGENGLSMYDIATKFSAYDTSKSVIDIAEEKKDKVYAVDSFFTADGKLDTESSEPLTIVCIGGSLTELGNSVWVQGLHEYFAERFPNREVTIYNAGVGGSTSEFNSVRFASQVLSKNPDLVIIECTVNDQQFQSTDKTRHQMYIENMIRQCLDADKVPAVVYAHTPFAVDKESAKYTDYTRMTAWKEEVVTHYGMSYVNIYDYFYNLYLAELETNPELDYLSFLDRYYKRSASNLYCDYFDVHPKAEGYGVYLEAFKSAFDAELEVMLSRLRDVGTYCTEGAQTVHRDSVLLPHNSDRITYDDKWTVYTEESPYNNADSNALIPYTTPNRYAFPFFDNGVHAAYKQSGASFTFKTTANALVLYYQQHKAGMKATVYVDGVAMDTQFNTKGSAQQPCGSALVDLGNTEGEEVTVRVALDDVTASDYSFMFGYIAEIFYN